jgi:hypothetical protein
MPEQIVIVGAGVPGAVNSYYSELQQLDAVGDDASPPVGAYTLIPDIGFLLFKDLAATLSVVLRTDDSPETYVTIIATSGQGMVWSDGANVFVKNTAAPASPELTADYYVLAQKP